MADAQQPGLKNTTIGLMVAVALFFDVLQWVLVFIVMDWIVAWIFFPMYWLWFKMHGIAFISMKRAPTLAGGTLIEMIPGLDVLPAYTLIVVRVCLDNKIKAAVPGANITQLDIGQVSKGKGDAKSRT